MDKSSPVFMDSAAPFGFDFADQFLQYQPSTYGVPIPQASPRLGFSNLNIGTPEFGSYPGAATYTSSAPTTPNQRPFTPIDAISPQITSLSHAQLSGASDNDGFNSSGKRSRDHSGRSESPLSGPASQPGAGLVHRQPLRRGSSTTTTRSRLAKRRARDDDLDSDEDIGDGDYAPAGTDSYDGPLKTGVKRKEDVRKQRIESEQRRRDELREGYRKLKDVLPSSNQKSSKVSLLDRATLHIKYLEMTQQQLQARLQAAEMETQRLRLVNEKMMLATAEHNQQAMAAAAAQVSMAHY
ncbi:hypothetical protein EXIGLDRAFT_776685 [Exidia glandulosa HHB12029]|uniref:BHLH domain-containing protein n=1 Tax=Exidia glandulosa HHB12029 TaxID=1314781 RepID=A0A165DDQ2_EXIGL|nr:hypothetical protein EXIGLDRAFT_776685 [Exidia glandulosa HHB12029]